MSPNIIGLVALIAFLFLLWIRREILMWVRTSFETTIRTHLAGKIVDVVYGLVSYVISMIFFLVGYIGIFHFVLGTMLAKSIPLLSVFQITDWGATLEVVATILNAPFLVLGALKSIIVFVFTFGKVNEFNALTAANPWYWTLPVASIVALSVEYVSWSVLDWDNESSKGKRTMGQRWAIYIGSYFLLFLPLAYFYIKHYVKIEPGPLTDYFANMINGISGNAPAPTAATTTTVPTDAFGNPLGPSPSTGFSWSWWYLLWLAIPALLFAAYKFGLLKKLPIQGLGKDKEKEKGPDMSPGAAYGRLYQNPDIYPLFSQDITILIEAVSTLKQKPEKGEEERDFMQKAENLITQRKNDYGKKMVERYTAAHALLQKLGSGQPINGDDFKRIGVIEGDPVFSHIAKTARQAIANEKK